LWTPIFDVIGIPASPEKREACQRHGDFRIEGDWLITPAVNEGQPVHIRRQGRDLILTIDGNLRFRFRRT
jgi:hypothetical protein